MKQLKTYLKEQRIKKGMTQWDLAKRLGHTTAQWVSNVERGVSPIGQTTLKKMIKPLELDRKLVKKFLIKEFERKLDKLDI
jgi:transcriptional regulator with XRE-family HTH domain